MISEFLIFCCGWREEGMGRKGREGAGFGYDC